MAQARSVPLILCWGLEAYYKMELFDPVSGISHPTPHKSFLQTYCILYSFFIQERQQVEWWIDGLRRVKVFWNQYKRRNESLNEEEQPEIGIESSENAHDEEVQYSLEVT